MSLCKKIKIAEGEHCRYSESILKDLDKSILLAPFTQYAGFVPLHIVVCDTRCTDIAEKQTFAVVGNALELHI